jgi:hypothetical protein
VRCLHDGSKGVDSTDEGVEDFFFGFGDEITLIEYDEVCEFELIECDIRIRCEE